MTDDPFEPIAEAIRFAEEYGYNRWTEAQDALNELRRRVRGEEPVPLEAFIDEDGLMKQKRVRDIGYCGYATLDPDRGTMLCILDIHHDNDKHFDPDAQYGPRHWFDGMQWIPEYELKEADLYFEHVTIGHEETVSVTHRPTGKKAMYVRRGQSLIKIHEILLNDLRFQLEESKRT